MMLYLSGDPVFIIIKLGRWLSDDFLDYFEQQNLSFSKGISIKMLHLNTCFNFPVKKQISARNGENHAENNLPNQINHYKRPSQLPS